MLKKVMAEIQTKSPFLRPDGKPKKYYTEYDGEQPIFIFVKDICKDRDESHGFPHMKKVMETSFEILSASLTKMEESGYFKREMNIFKTPVEGRNIDEDVREKSIEAVALYVALVALLHDVADHKYDVDGTLNAQVEDFLINELELKKEGAEFVMNIIEHISYSKENKAIQSGHPINFKEVLGEMGEDIRDIVSDADKLEALGKIGLERCVEYTKHAHREKTGEEIPEELLKQKVIEHAHEKLLRLKDEFIRTEKGKELAEPLHQELLEELNKM
jgi:uncharacterized protein